MKVGDITSEEMQELISFANADKMFGVAFKGALSQIRHKLHLQKQGYEIEENHSSNKGLPDFIVNGHLVEHKRARNESYSDGKIKVEIQKSRKSGDCKSNRLYDATFCTVVAVDIGEHTGKKNDYRYINVNSLERHVDFPDKIKVFQKQNKSWKNSLSEALNESR